MKKAMMVLAVTVAAMCAGCFTSATAWTESTSKDGVTSRSKVRIIGTGDKASQIASEGLFADGGDHGDLGAGVRKATASQASTGIEGTLAGLGTLMGGMSQLAAVMRPGLPTIAPDGAVSVDIAGDGDAASYVPASGYSGAPGEGGIGIYGRTTCGRCQAYMRAHPDMQMIDIDVAGNRQAMWAALRARGFTGAGVQLPVIITPTAWVERAK